MSPAGTRQRTAKTALDSINEIASVRIELVGSEPLIWRQVEVPTSITLKVLHDVIQAVMGWFDSHLWEFTIGKRRYGLPAEDDAWGAEAPADATKVRLREVLKPGKTRIDYLYDFGDGWEHRLIVSQVRAGAPDVGYPRYVGGEQVAPPEDCGGIYGFYDRLEALADPKHPDHVEVVEWLEGYDPHDFDELPIKYALGRIAARRRAAQTRAQKRSGR
jgi:hypothetical protein